MDVLIAHQSSQYYEHFSLTELLEHLVALVEDEVLEVLEVELLAADEGEDPAGRAHHDVRAVRLEHLLVLRDRQTAEEHTHLEKVATFLTTVHYLGVLWSFVSP